MAVRGGLTSTFRALNRASSLNSVPARAFSGTSASLALPGRGERRFVRISGVSSYASSEDVQHFLARNDVQVPAVPSEDSVLPVLTQGTSDVFQNISVWLYDAGTSADALQASNALSGKVAGMKLIRSSAVDYRIISDMVGEGSSNTNNKGHRRKKSLRKQLSVIAPSVDERGRTVLVTNIHAGCVPRAVWGFFGSFDIVDVRMLRRSGVASVIFRNQKEALRAIRERTNSLLQGKSRVNVKMFE